MICDFCSAYFDEGYIFRCEDHETENSEIEIIHQCCFICTSTIMPPIMQRFCKTHGLPSSPEAIGQAFAAAEHAMTETLEGYK
jgi:hypothetical protein